jgi:ABC-2 type transport system permease protein
MRPARAGLRDAAAAEWIKLMTLRSTRRLVTALGLALPAMALLVALTESLQPDDTILGASVLGGAVLAQLLAATLGATLVTGEGRTGLLRVTLAACPRRGTVLVAKALVAAAVAFLATLTGSTAAFGVGRALLAGEGYATGAPWPSLLGVALAVAALAAIGVGLGAMVRHGATAVGVAIGLVLLPSLFAPLLGDARRWLGGASFDGVMQKLAQSSDATHETVGSLGPWPSIVGVLAVAALAVVGGTAVLRRRDV